MLNIEYYVIFVITVICWSRDVVSRLIHNFYYVAARDVKIEKSAELWAIIEPR